MRSRFWVASAAVLAFGAVAPAGASAATATVTNDTGAPTALGGGVVTIRHMDPNVDVEFTENEKRRTVAVFAPNGESAIFGSMLCSTGDFTPTSLRYLGNGTYTIIVKTYGQDDTSCTGTPSESKFTFNVNAFSGVAAPGPKLLTREPGKIPRLAYPFKVEVNPGASRTEVRYAAAATVGPDGAIVGAADVASVDPSGNAAITFFKPGTYTIVARPVADNPGPWSAPVTVQVFEPFDFTGFVTFPDSRGPTYRLTGQIREATATGTVTVAIAKGKNGKRFKRLGKAKIRRGGKFALRFKLRKAGFYTMRYTYRGNATVAPGFVKEVVRIRRVVTFRRG